MTTLSVIGPAVFNGGLSTFLAFVLLGFSQAYVFMTFFKVRQGTSRFHRHYHIRKNINIAKITLVFIYFTLFQLFASVVVFGLFHGLLFLPVILSVAGPGERNQDKPKEDQATQYHNGYYTVSLSQNGKGNIFGRL